MLNNDVIHRFHHETGFNSTHFSYVKLRKYQRNNTKKDSQLSALTENFFFGAKCQTMKLYKRWMRPDAGLVEYLILYLFFVQSIEVLHRFS